MRCPILIGRQEPAGLIAAAVRQLARSSHGSALVVTGEAGIGKSRLADLARHQRLLDLDRPSRGAIS